MNRRNFIHILAGVTIAAGLSLPLRSFYKSFGSNPESVSSPNWRHGAFHNLPNARPPFNPVDLAREPQATGGWLKFFLSKDDNRYPPHPVPSRKTDLQNLSDGQFVWLGHSSLLCRLNGKYICIDPVLSSHASPIPGFISAWPGSSPYSAHDFPVIDWLLVSHDHWDHLDYKAVNELKFRNILCGLGTGSHFKSWGLAHNLHELDWHHQLQADGMRFVFTPSCHFSGRTFTRNKTLWGGIIIDAGSGGKIYFSGDGGYGSHFRDIGKKYGPFDIMLPDSGQYNRAWANAHMFPEQSVQACLDAGSKLGCPVHRGKFTLSWHPWNDPETRFAAAAMGKLPFIIPQIGEKCSIG